MIYQMMDAEKNQMEFTEVELPDVAERIVSLLEKYPLVFLYGEMGAGKTRLVREIAKILNCSDEVGSPTFSIINEYHCSNNLLNVSKLFHIDLYRLNTVEELRNIGLIDYYDSKDPCFVEWPQISEQLTRGLRVLRIHLEVLENNARKITLTN